MYHWIKLLPDRLAVIAKVDGSGVTWDGGWYPHKQRGKMYLMGPKIPSQEVLIKLQLLINEVNSATLGPVTSD